MTTTVLKKYQVPVTASVYEMLIGRQQTWIKMNSNIKIEGQK